MACSVVIFIVCAPLSSIFNFVIICDCESFLILPIVICFLYFPSTCMYCGLSYFINYGHEKSSHWEQRISWSDPVFFVRGKIRWFFVCAVTASPRCTLEPTVLRWWKQERDPVLCEAVCVCPCVAVKYFLWKKPRNGCGLWTVTWIVCWLGTFMSTSYYQYRSVKGTREVTRGSGVRWWKRRKTPSGGPGDLDQVPTNLCWARWDFQQHVP